MQERKKKLHSNCFEFMKSFGFVVTMFVRSGGEGMDVSMGLEQELRLFTLMLCILLEKCYIFLVWWNGRKRIFIWLTYIDISPRLAYLVYWLIIRSTVAPYFSISQRVNIATSWETRVKILLWRICVKKFWTAWLHWCFYTFLKLVFSILNTSFERLLLLYKSNANNNMLNLCLY